MRPPRNPPPTTDFELDLPADRYAIEREIGRGGYATVFQARDLRHQRSVAIKVLKPELTSQVGLDRFQAEIELAASLAHPNIVPVFDSGAAGQTLFYVMPLVEGESLRQKLERDGPLPPADVMRIATDVAHALSYAHNRGVVHRDIKPENILLMQSGGHALVADFGIAKALSGAGQRRLTITGSAIGTPMYMSPEQSIGLPVDARADIYSFAAVVFEMFTGMPPMPGSGARDVLTNTPTGEIPERLSRPARLPRDVRPVLAKALQGEPADRHSTVDAFMEALETAISVDPGFLKRLGRRRTRAQKARIALGGAAFVLIAAAGVFAFSKLRASTPRDGRGVVIFPFRTTTSTSIEWREAIPDLLATQLDGTPGVRVADPWSLWLPLRRERGDLARSPDPDEARDIARRADACCFVLGSVSDVPGRVDVSVRVYELGSDEPLHTFSAGGPADSVGSIVRQLSLELIRRLAQGGEPSSSVAIAERTIPRTPAALKTWLSAREYLRRGSFDSADVAITRSLAEDSSFAPSLTDAAAIRSWVQFIGGQPYANLRGLAERAVALSDSTTPRTRLRAQAMLAAIATNGAEVARATTAILSDDPTDFDAWNMLTYSHIAYGWQYGVTPNETRDAMERLYRLDTTSTTSITRGAFLAISLNDEPGTREHLARLKRSDTTTVLARGTISGIESLMASDAAFQSSIGAQTRTSAPEWIGRLRLLRLFRPDRAEHLARATLADETSPLRPFALGALLQVLAGGNQWAAVDSVRRTPVFALRGGLSTALDRMSVAASLMGGATTPRAGVAVARLAEGMPPDSALALFNSRNVWHDGWLIGAFNAMHGDIGLAKQWSDAMGTLPPGGSPREYGKALQADIEARLALRAGNSAAAMEHAQRAYALWDVHTENQLEMMPEPAIRFHLASLLRDAGKADSARALFSSFVPPTTWMGFYTVRAALELAELEERAGLRDDAERHYMLASRWLERADDDAAALRARAAAGLRRLSG